VGVLGRTEPPRPLAARSGRKRPPCVAAQLKRSDIIKLRSSTKRNILSKAATTINVLLPAILFTLTLSFYAAVIAYTGFNGLYGQDPYGYYDYARALIGGTSLALLPQANYWPAGYPVIIAVCIGLLGDQPLAAQLPSVIAGAAAVALIALLIRDLALLERRTPEQAMIAGLIAGGVALSGGQYTQWSVSAMADAPALLWALLAVWALVRWAGAVRLHWLLLAGMALAAAISTRWMYVVLVPAYALFVLAADLGEQEPAIRSVRGLVRSVVVFLIAVLIGVLPQVWLSRVASGEIARSHWISEWSLLNAFRRTFTSSDGQATYPLPIGLFYLRAFGSPRMLSPLFWLLLPFGLWALWRWRMWRAAMLLLSWGGLVSILLAGLPYQNARYTLAQIPVVAGVAGLGATWVWGALPWLRRPLALFCLIGVLIGSWYGLGIVQEMAARQQSDRATARWVEQSLPAGAHLLAFELTLTLQHETSLDVRELYGISIAQLEAEVALPRPLFLLVETSKLRRQWAGTALEGSYVWLRDGPGLSELGRMNGYALYRVGK